MAEQKPGSSFEPVGPLSEMVFSPPDNRATEGRVVRWLKQEREITGRGELVVEVEVGQEIVTIVAPQAGALWWHSVEAGAVISPGARLGWLLPDESTPIRPAPPGESRLWQIITVLALIGMLISIMLIIFLSIQRLHG